jgi:hypothetical protein
MNPTDSIYKVATFMKVFRTSSVVRRAALVLLLAFPLMAAAAEQETFATPQEAVDALLAALKADDDAAMLAVFGEEHKNLIVTSDSAADSATRARVLALMQTFYNLGESGSDRRILFIGDQAWPMPIPLVRSGPRWRFATEEGSEEIINRRIGANELNAIMVMRAYLEAQRQYASLDRDQDGVLQYAQKLASTPGLHDGLYWTADENTGEEPSPFGPLIAQSVAYFKGRQAGDAYHGYHFRILSRQGKSAAGGAYGYVINGHMIAGFAMVAYPDDYGESGVMTFIVNHNGRVFEKDLGRSSARMGAAMQSFDPGAGWRAVAR